MNSQKKNFGFWIMWACVLALFIVRLLHPRWATFNTQAVLSWDVMGYYLYLPASFIYGDLLHFSFIPDILETYRNTGSFYQAFLLENGNHLIKYPLGLAICYFPFFLIGHFAAWISGYPMDGFSPPYQLAIGLSPVFYAGLGFYFLRKALNKYFKDIIVGLCFLWLILGTNFLQYVSIDGAMPHGYLFTFYCLVVYLSQRWHEEQKYRYAILVGVLIGWATIIRPTELIMALIPLLWGISNKESLIKKWNLILKNRYQILSTIAAVCIMILPQILYWKWASGSFLYYSYEEQGFDWKTPHFFDVLLGFRKGFFLYTPLAALPFIGFLFLFSKARETFLPLTVFIFLNLYIICSWSIWWYSGSYSCRALVQSYPLLFFPLAALLTYLWRSGFAKILLSILFILLSALNVFQLWQYNKGIIHAEEMTKHYYYAIFGKTEISQEEMLFMDVKKSPKNPEEFEKVELARINFDNDSLVFPIVTGWGIDSSQAWKSSPEHRESPLILLPVSDLPSGNGNWLKASVMYRPEWGSPAAWLVVRALKDNQQLQWRAVRLYHYLTKGYDWNEIYFYYPLPASEGADRLEVFVQNNGGTSFIIDDLKVELLFLE